MLREVLDGLVLAGFSFFVFVILILFPVLAFGPDFETRYAPVVDNVVVTSVDSNFVPPEVLKQSTLSGAVWYKITFNKMRVCIPETDVFAWYVVHLDGKKERVNLIPYWEQDVSPGEHSYYVQVDQVSSVPFTSQIFILAHSCQPLWLSRTRINIPINSNSIKFR